MTTVRVAPSAAHVRRFYHRTVAGMSTVLLALSLASNPAGAAATTEPPAKAPPRTIDDLTRLLEHYKPDAAAAAKAQAAADQTAPETTDNAVLFDFYYARGMAAAQIGRISQQLTDLKKALDLSQGASDNRERVRAMRDLAAAEVSGGNLLRAIQLAEEAAKLSEGQNQGQALGSYQQLSIFYVLVGDFDKAANALTQAERIFAALRQTRGWQAFGDNWTANLERTRAEVFRGEGKMVEAEGAYRKALRHLELFITRLRDGNTPPNWSELDTLRSERFRTVLMRGIANTLAAQGKQVDTEVMLRRVLKIDLERNGLAATDTATTLQKLASCLAEQGRYAEAARMAQEALRSYEQAGATPESSFVAQARKALGTIYVSQHKYEDAIRAFNRMRDDLQRDPALAVRMLSGDLDWVLALLRTNQQAAAETMAKAMLDKAQQRPGNAGRVAEVRAFYAMTLLGRGALEDAQREFRQSVPILIEQARNDDENGTGGLKRQQRLVTVLESYISLLNAMGRGQPAFMAEAAAESFRLADIARGSSVQRALTASAARASIANPQLAELARQEQDAQRRIIALGELLSQLLAAPPAQQLPAVQAKIQSDIDALKASRTRLKQEIERRFPEYAELVDPKPTTLAQTQKLLRPGEALLSWYFGESGGWAWGLSTSGEAHFSDVPFNREQIAAQVRQLRKALDPGVATIDDIPAFDVRAAHQLYLSLLQPLAPSWQGASNLLAIPHAELGQLPLALLPTAAVAQPGKTSPPFTEYRHVPWLARQIAITQLPSVTALASLRRLPPPSADRRAFIGFGDPLFNVDQAKQAERQNAVAARADAGLATRGRTRLQTRSVPQTTNVSSAELGILPRLPDTSQEIREIAKVLQADPEQDIYLQKRATVKTVLGMDLAQRRIVMFATHGLVPGELDGLVQPALALTSPEVADPDSDGLLTMDKILTLKLNADWVVLSACNTAAGEGSGAEAVSGLGRAFFYSGARALLVSNWPVETVAARKLMTDLFRRQVSASGLGKAEALRQSMLGLLDGPGSVDEKSGRVSFSYAHPLFWAPFVVVGD